MKKEKVFERLYSIFGKWLPTSSRSKFAKKVRFFFAKRILKSIGTEVNIEKGASFNYRCSDGDKSGIGIRCELNGPVSIGKYVNMGPDVVVYTRNHCSSRTDVIMQKQGYEEFRAVKIEDDVWIGRRAIILPGVTIGTGSIIGAGAVVTKSVPPYSVAVGNPARVVKNRLQKSDTNTALDS